MTALTDAELDERRDQACREADQQFADGLITRRECAELKRRAKVARDAYARSRARSEWVNGKGAA